MWTPSVWRRVARWNCKNGFDPRKTCTEPACIVCLESHIGTVASHYQPLSGLLHCGRWCPQSWWPGTAPGCVLLSSTVYPNFILIQAWVSLARVHGGDGEANAGFLRFRQIMNESRKVELWFCKWGRHGAKTLAKTILLWCSAFWTRMAMTTDLGPCLWTRLSALCCVLKSVCICLHFVSNSWLETISNRVWWKPSIWGRRLRSGLPQAKEARVLKRKFPPSSETKKCQLCGVSSDDSPWHQHAKGAPKGARCLSCSQMVPGSNDFMI